VSLTLRLRRRKALRLRSGLDICPSASIKNHLKGSDLNHHKPVHPRPRAVTVLAFGVLTIAGLNTARLVLALARWQALADFPGVPRFYIALTGAIGAAGAWPLAWGLWRGKTWARRGIHLAVFVVSGWYWIDRIFLADRSAGFGPSLPVNWSFAAVLNGIVILWVIWTLSRQKSKRYFGDLNE